MNCHISKYVVYVHESQWDDFLFLPLGQHCLSTAHEYTSAAVED